MPRKLLFVLIAAVVLAAAGTAWWWHAARTRQDLVAATLPPAPDLSSASVPLRAALAAAEARSRELSTARDGLVELGRLYHANGYLDEAVACYQGLAQIEPDEARWPHLHATILAGFGEIDPAIALWQRAVRLAPDYTPAALRLGDSLLKANRPDEAVAVYQGILARNPAEPHALLGLARIDFEAGRDGPARERLERVVQLTNYQLGYDLIVSLYERIGLHDRAAAIRGMAESFGAYRDPADPWHDTLIDDCYDTYRIALAAGVLDRNGDPAGARQLLQRALALDPNDISARFQLGTLAVRQGDLRTAREQLERCTVLDPTFADPWAHLSSLHERLGDQAAADRVLTTGLHHCPQSPGLHLMRARRLKAAGRLDEAFAEYHTSIRYRPNEPDAYIELANALISSGREAEGVAQMRIALETDPANPVILVVLAMHNISQGNESEAREWMQRIANQPRVPREHAARLQESFRQKFGRDWRR
jgi:Tfp pilus assembly protein PilF